MVKWDGRGGGVQGNNARHFLKWLQNEVMPLLYTRPSLGDTQVLADHNVNMNDQFFLISVNANVMPLK